MSQLAGLALALFGGGTLGGIVVALLNGWFGKAKANSDIHKNEVQNYMTELTYSREQLALERAEKLEMKGELKALREQALLEKTECQREIAELKLRIEVMSETISKMGTEINILKNQ